jgi:tRNA threonylcarbamoyladenosine biosynthesis protein TsaB
MAHILHIDTSTDKAVVALSTAGRLVHESISADSRNHAATINLMISEVVAHAGLILADLDACAVIGGPGSYTGLRIGLSTAKGLCYVLDKPMLLTNKLSLLTLQQMESTGRQYRHYLTVMPAREQEYFACVYNNESVELIPPQHMHQTQLDELIVRYQPDLLITSTVSAQLLPVSADLNLANHYEIDNAYWAKQEQRGFDCNSFVNLATAEPFYLKQVYTHTKR